jgi:hypothetical protein
MRQKHAGHVRRWFAAFDPNYLPRSERKPDE